MSPGSRISRLVRSRISRRLDGSVTLPHLKGKRMFHFILRACRLRRRVVRGTALSLVVALLFSACGQIPDISKFAEASAGMTGAIRKGYAQTDELLAEVSVGPEFDPDTRAKLADRRKTLKDSIGPTLK